MVMEKATAFADRDRAGRGRGGERRRPGRGSPTPRCGPIRAKTRSNVRKLPPLSPAAPRRRRHDRDPPARAPSDEPAWRLLWRDYLAFYETELPEAVYAASFARLTDPEVRDYHGLLALRDDAPVGLAHYIFHRHGWQIADVCYLQDLYVAPGGARHRRRTGADRGGLRRGRRRRRRRTSTG